MRFCGSFVERERSPARCRGQDHPAYQQCDDGGAR
jgi:hypothetical protein